MSKCFGFGLFALPSQLARQSTKYYWRWFRLTGLMLLQLALFSTLFMFVFPEQVPAQTLPNDPPPLSQTEYLSSPAQTANPFNSGTSPGLIPVRQTNTTLAVSIVSSPWTPVDSNSQPGQADGDVPDAFVVEAVVTNTGSFTALGLLVDLDFNAANNWELLLGEQARRSISELAPGQAYHAYWLATYPQQHTPAATHQYTVTAQADNATAVSTSDNAYGNPAAGATVSTKKYLSTGNSGLAGFDANVVVGVAFTVTQDYELGTNANDIIFSPVGNTDFDPSGYRLLSTRVRFYDDPFTQEAIIDDRLYFPALPAFADRAQVSYTFIALTPTNTRLCSYTAIGFNSQDKYDLNFCSESQSAVIPISGTVTVEASKLASSATIQQGQLITYTINYTNAGTQAIQYVWFWDDIITDYMSIIPGSISPASDADETNESRVAWNIGTISPSETGSLTFSVLVDGNGNDLADGTEIVNNAFLGIDQGKLPGRAALTNTVTTTVQAPTISIVKTDGQASAEPDDNLSYSIQITNNGSIPATNILLTDLLPSEVVTNGSATPPASSQIGQTLTWTDLGTIPANDSAQIVVPVTVNTQAADGTILLNTAQVSYQNEAGHTYNTKIATDTTTVQGPVLSISKTASPDPVLTGNDLVYTLYYTNSGPSEATNVVITDVTPANTTYQSCGGAACSESGGIVSWSLSTVSGGSNGSVSFSVTVTDALQTGEEIDNADYGINADQIAFVAGPAISTLVQRDAAIIEGYAFDDVNGNGVFDGGESGISGVTITLLEATTPVTTTDGSGYYRFRVEEEIPISVSTSLPAGFFRTTPGQVVYLDTTLGQTKTINFGFAATGSPFGVIFGTVFEDSNADGVQGLGENGLSGVQVASAQAASSPATSNVFGQYSLRFNSSGPVTIRETDPPFYVSTTSNEVTVSAQTGSSGPSPVDFGDFNGVQISGQVFVDANVNGINDDGAGLAGATVSANSAGYLTTSSGLYTLYLQINDSNPILITETDPGGYLSTNAIPGAGMSRIDASTLQIDSPTAGNLYSGHFGDVQTSQSVIISGQVWDDNGVGGGQMANGQPDGTEPGLSGAIITLSSGLTTTTGSDGVYTLPGPADQTIMVIETNPAGYVSTNAIPGNDAVKSNNDMIIVNPLTGGSTSTDNLFGDVLLSNVALISGTVFDDQNENGIFDGLDVGLSGVEITLEIEGSGTFTVSSAADGSYQFPLAPGNNVRITSTGPGGSYYATTSQTIFESVSAAGILPDRNFGYSDDADVAVIMGTVFDDQDGDGRQEFGEGGLSGATIRLDGGSPQVTGISGGFTYAVQNTQVYQLSETDPPGYRSTTANQVNVDVDTLGQSYQVTFGDTNSSTNSTIFGTVFDDQNGDGQQDGNEPGLAGVVVTVTVGINDVPLLTDQLGRYSHGTTTAGVHRVSEQNPPGYRSTTPDALNVLVLPGQSYEVNFGDTTNTGFSTLMGIVFDDDDGDGMQDFEPDEPGVAGVTVSLSSGQTTTTDANGRYTFAISQLGPVTVSETDLPTYHSTTPNEVIVNIAALGQIYVVNFGDSDNANLASFFGTVFDDQNGNGAREIDEPILSGVTVFLNGLNSVPTNEWGQYTFAIDSPGTYSVSETDPPNYTSSNAIPGSGSVVKIDNNTLQANLSGLGADLGDNQFADITDTSLTLTKTAADLDGAPVEVDDTILYTLRVTNSGAYTAYNVTVSDDLPDGLTYGDASASLGNVAGTDPLLWRISVLPVGIEATLTITMTIDNDQAGAIITNTAAASSTNVSNPPPNTDPICLDGSLEPCDPVQGPASLQFDKLAADVNGPPLLVGDTIRYTLLVTNSSLIEARNIVLGDNLPDGLTLIETAPSQGTVSGTDVLTWSLGNLNGEAGASLLLTATINLDQAGQSIVNSGVVTGENAVIITPPPAVCPDGLPANPDGSCPNTPIPTTTLSLAKTAADLNGDPLLEGDLVRYTIQVTNTGAYSALNVAVTDDLPDGVSLVSTSADLGVVSGTNIITWAIDALPSGASATLTIDVTIDFGTQGQSITNTATVSSINVIDPPPDPTPVCLDGSLANPDGSCDVTPIAGGDLSGSAKSAGPVDQSLIVGDSVAYTITLQNSAAVWADPVTVTDDLPSSVSLESVGVCQPPDPEPQPETYMVYLPLTLNNVGPGQVQAQGSLLSRGATPRDGHYVEYDLTIAGNGFTWVGAIAGNETVELCISATIVSPVSINNTAYISWAGQSISVSTDIDTTPAPAPTSFERYIPMVIK